MSESHRLKHQARQSADWMLDKDGTPMGLIGPDGKLYQVATVETDEVTGRIEKAKAADTTLNVAAQRESIPEDFDIFDLYAFTGRRQMSLPNPASGIGSGLVHPCVVFVPQGFAGWRYWMAYTPYPLGNSAYENPCVAVSQDGESWETPYGVTNPLAEKPAGGYNADTHIFISPDCAKIYIAWRERIDGVSNKIKVIESSDGEEWSSPATILSGVYGVTDYASPSIWYDKSAGRWNCLSHNLDAAGYPMQLNQTSGSDLYSGWGAEQAVTMPNPTAGRTFWHSFFTATSAGRVVGLIQDIVVAGAGAPGALFAAESLDGGLTFATRLVYPDAGFYRCAFNFAAIDSGDVGLNVWIGRQDTLGYNIYREDWRPGAVGKEVSDIARNNLLFGGYKNSVLWLDAFNRANGAIGTPTVGAALTVDAGTFSIASNQLVTGSAGNNRALVSVGQADYMAEVTFAAAAGTAIWLWFRAVDTNNFHRVGVGAGLNNTLYVQKFVAGATEYSIPVPGPVFQSIVSAGDRVRVVCRGRRFRIYVNEVLWYEMEDASFHSTGVKFGVQGTNAAVAFDNILVIK